MVRISSVASYTNIDLREFLEELAHTLERNSGSLEQFRVITEPSNPPAYNPEIGPLTCDAIATHLQASHCRLLLFQPWSWRRSSSALITILTGYNREDSPFLTKIFLVSQLRSPTKSAGNPVRFTSRSVLWGERAVSASIPKQASCNAEDHGMHASKVRVQEVLTSDYAIVADVGEAWFLAQKLQLPEGCRLEMQMQYASIGWGVGERLPHTWVLFANHMKLSSYTGNSPIIARISHHSTNTSVAWQSRVACCRYRKIAG